MEKETLEKANAIQAEINKLQLFLDVSFAGSLKLKAKKTNHGGGIGLETYTEEEISLTGDVKEEVQSIIKTKLEKFNEKLSKL